MQSALRKAVEEGRVAADEASAPMMIATEHLLRSYSFYRYKAANFDIPYLQGRFDSLKHDVIEIDGQEPTLAASTFNSLEPIIRDKFTGIIINVIPVASRKMFVIFSYAADEAGRARASLDRILSSSGGLQKFELSKHLLAVTENFALNPTFVDSWSDEKREAIIRAFEKTINALPEVGENSEFMLF